MVGLQISTLLKADSMAAYDLMSCLTINIHYELVDMLDAKISASNALHSSEIL